MSPRSLRSLGGCTLALATLANARWVLVGCIIKRPHYSHWAYDCSTWAAIKAQRGGGRAVRERGAPPWACLSATGRTQKVQGSALPKVACAP